MTFSSKGAVGSLEIPGIVVSLEIPGIVVSLEIPGIVVSLQIPGIVVSLVISIPGRKSIFFIVKLDFFIVKMIRKKIPKFSYM